MENKPILKFCSIYSFCQFLTQQNVADIQTTQFCSFALSFNIQEAALFIADFLWVAWSTTQGKRGWEPVGVEKGERWKIGEGLPRATEPTPFVHGSILNPAFCFTVQNIVFCHIRRSGP